MLNFRALENIPKMRLERDREVAESDCKNNLQPMSLEYE